MQRVVYKYEYSNVSAVNVRVLSVRWVLWDPALFDTNLVAPIRRKP